MYLSPFYFPAMTEEFLHYIWLYRLFPADTTLVSGEKLAVLATGIRNDDSGPDFFNSRIRIGETEWAGNIEVHLNSSDWLRHGHQEDKAYSNVILHVVFRSDVMLADRLGNPLPTLELNEKINETAWKRYLQFMASKMWVPCQHMIPGVDNIIIESWLDRLVAERFERKSETIGDILRSTGNNWNEAFYTLLASGMGFKVNQDAFLLLSRKLPYQYLFKHADNLLQIEALVFGQAGLLEDDFMDEYPKSLQKEYAFLRTKFMLEPMPGHLWRFMRLHPGNFPTIRLAQFASLLNHSGGLPSAVLDAAEVTGIRSLFNTGTSEYWISHYRFDKTSPHRIKNIGDESVDLLIINLVAPFIYFFGKYINDEKQKAKAGNLLLELKGEQNAITRQWKNLGMNTGSAYHTQALLELKNNYCNFKKCLNCRIGNAILR